jgi:PAP2 superfamily protein
VKITGFYQKHFGEADNLILNLELILALFGYVFILLNAVTFQYRGVHFLSYHWTWVAPALFGTALFSNSWFKMNPNLSFILKSYCFYILGLFAFASIIEGIQYTPFPTVDHLMSAADQALQIQETVILSWVNVHPILLTVLRVTYHSIVLQWLLAPALLFFLLGKRQVYLFLVISLLAYAIGAGIYYFFPSVGPASIYNDPLFSQWQLDAVTNFKQVHQYLFITNFDEPIEFCHSFHTLFAVVAIFIYRKAPIAIFAPILLLNVTAIVATLCLGWSYGIDIATSILVACIAIYCGKRLLHSRLFNNT